ncbi:MAG: S9 family peptidase [Acidimicrobiales bacterium]
MPGTVAPYGTWSSPISSDLLTEAAVGLSGVTVIDGRVWWSERRPSDAGRQVLVAADPGDPTSAEDQLDSPHSARTQVHEYGGRCWTGRDGLLVWSEWADQRLWMARHRDEPWPLTPEPDRPRALRYADPVLTGDARTLICIREHHRGEGDVVNDLVALALDVECPEPVVLARGHDFFSAPRLSPAGDRLAWLTWDHPDMPWDRTALWEAPYHVERALGPARLVAGGTGRAVSISQPRYGPDATLHYISDRTGWWNLYADDGEAGRPLAPLEAEFAGPDWVFGQATYAFAPDGRLVATWTDAAGGHLGVVGKEGVQPLRLPFSQYSSLAALPGSVVAVVASPTTAPAVVRIDLDEPAATVLRASRPDRLDPALVSLPEPVTFASGDESAHAWYYPPTNPDFAGPDNESPPLLVMSHGGPTGAASPVLDLGLQYWTSRGFAVADVDYRGSSGYGRRYRDLLRGQWGRLDVEDCTAVVAWLASRGCADDTRAVIRGASAGGFTTLAALAFTDAFAAGSSRYGVADLELLARETHKFESRYLDGLVGPWPADAERYRQRSPIHHLERLTCPVILFQGSDDAVVPPAQAEAIFAALCERGVPVAYLRFEGEGHGFRSSETIRAVAEAELAFFGRVLGFVPADAPALPPIEHGDRLPLPSESSPTGPAPVNPRL